MIRRTHCSVASGIRFSTKMVGSLIPMDPLGRLLRDARQAYRAALDEDLRSLGVTPSQFGVLSRLNASGGLSVAQLARRTFVTPQTAHEVVGQLERAGLVRREPHPELGRVLRTYLTPEGRAALERCAPRAAAIEAQTLADLSPEERVQLVTLLKRALESLQRHREANAPV